ncbi:(2Fe-2S)-binding protein [Mycobacterium sp. 1164966.3]|uniref:(2Fe-2S)-binding protein n=1 Tax=Mycobacterium sp. 1164966.3 TaxID=1856861 RepID=UPI000800B9B1|nr:(2Fe-2S)-binding protein [Mycobacterium sp. 1164966.3]OBA84590.1 (2Fe-2S)-binding protein [Mycobacterium sp. 1164966.3]
MWVCLCNGITSQMVADAVAAGASTTKDVAQACGAGADCGRCRRTVRAMITSTSTDRPARMGVSNVGDMDGF